MNMSLYDSEIGDVSVINPHDLGGHYDATESANWHVMKGVANTLGRQGQIWLHLWKRTSAAAVTAAAGVDADLVTGFTTLAATNELAAAAIGAGLLLTLMQKAAVITGTMLAAGLIIDPEMSSHATAYGTILHVIHAGSS